MEPEDQHNWWFWEELRKRAIVTAIWGTVQLMDKKNTEELINILGLNEKLDQLEFAKGVQYYIKYTIYRGRSEKERTSKKKKWRKKLGKLNWDTCRKMLIYWLWYSKTVRRHKGNGNEVNSVTSFHRDHTGRKMELSLSYDNETKTILKWIKAENPEIL